MDTRKSNKVDNATERGYTDPMKELFAEEYFDYYMDNSLFESANEYASLIEARYQETTA